MEAKELMLGDWVLWNSPQGKRPVKLSDWTRIAMEASECEPIPLTPEMLTKNGWDMYGCPDHKCWEHYQGAFEYGKQHVPFSICLFDFMNKGSMYCDDLYEQIIIHVRFVHELQRALRLCDLWELAETFEV